MLKHMRREQLFEFLEQKDLAFLLELLDACYDAMKSDQREAVFGKTSQ
jgi:hypothetical protein